MNNKPRKRIVDWDNEPAKRISDRLAALYLFLEWMDAKGELSAGMHDEIHRILEHGNPKAVKYSYAALLAEVGRDFEEGGVDL